jgi:flagellin
MSVINTNVKSLVAQNAMTVNNRSLSESMQQLSTGKRINSAKDDAAGFAISQRMTSQIRGLDQAVRNASDAISLIQTAEGALIEVNNMLQRMRELAVQSSTDSNMAGDKSALNSEFTQLRSEINRVALNTQWNGTNILDKGFAGGSGTFKFQVGANSNQTIDLTIGNYTTNSTSQGTTAAVATTANATGPGHATPAAQVTTLTIAGTPAIGDVITATVGDKSFSHTVTAGAAAVQTVTEIAAAINTGLGTISGVTSAASNGVLTFTGTLSTPFSISASQAGLLSGIRESNISTQSASNSAIGALDSALAAVTKGRAEMGATMNRLQYASDNLSNISTNTSASRSRIEDTDYAAATTELARTQIIQQAATAMLAQANQSGQSVLALLK